MFQFHNGTINTYAGDNSHYFELCFNSTTVQLIHDKKGAPITESLFQFHNGTINTIFPCLASTAKILFQFHNGTINTKLLSGIKRMLRSFNSTTVQLIHSSKHKKTVSVFSFNSTTVQLIHTTEAHTIYLT